MESFVAGLVPAKKAAIETLAEHMDIVHDPKDTKKQLAIKLWMRMHAGTASADAGVKGDDENDDGTSPASDGATDNDENDDGTSSADDGAKRIRMGKDGTAPPSAAFARCSRIAPCFFPIPHVFYSWAADAWCWQLSNLVSCSLIGVFLFRFLVGLTA